MTQTRTSLSALTTSLLVFALSAFVAAPAAAEDSKLESGEILVSTQNVSGSDIPKVVVKGVIEAPPEKVWQIVSKCGDYHRTMPRIESSKLVKTEGNKVTCKVEIDLPFPLSNLIATTVAVHTEKPDRFSREWDLVEGDYEKNTGSWVLTWYKGDPNRTMVVYTVHAVPKNVVPDWVREKAQKSSMPGVIERLREEVAKL